MFKKGVIRSRVMAHVDRIISEAENQLISDTKVLEDKLLADKEALIETQVQKILGKIL
jgi:hypothetical protein